jgi:hypothetical protein
LSLPTRCFFCGLLIRFGCIYFGKCRKEFRGQRVIDPTNEAAAAPGLVSKLCGSRYLSHHLSNTLGQHGLIDRAFWPEAAKLQQPI